MPSVTCLECGKTYGALSAHLRVHVMSLDDYRRKYPDAPTGWTFGNLWKEPVEGESQPEAPREVVTAPPDTSSPLDKVKDNLQASEKAEFEQRFQTLFEQADEDPALVAPIRDICLNEIYIIRYQRQLAKITSEHARPGAKSVKDQAAIIKTFNDLVKQTTEQNMRLMDSLNLTRAKKQAQRKTPESTPSRLIAGYERYLAAMSPDQLRRYNSDEEEAVRRLQRNLKALCDQVPVDAVAEEDTLDGK